ncbi:MAG: TorF family putative porin [Gammaproteobacteria bacterium]
MKQVLRGVALVGLSAVAMTAQAEFTGNIGWESTYVFRGVEQNDSSAQGGLDWSDSLGDSDLGYYVGTWAADVGEGLEIDYYGGINGELGEFSWLAGGTLYTYNDDFDDTYKEVNLGLGWKFLQLDAALGKYDGEATLSNGSIEDDPDYQVYELTAERNGFFAKIGVWADDADGEWFEAGYGWNWKGVDLTFKWVYTNDIGTFDETDDSNDNQLVVGAVYNFAVSDLWDKFQGAIQ